MLRFALAGLLLLGISQSQVAAQQPAATMAAPPKLPETLELSDGDSIVFLGDSITHQRLYTQYVEDYFYTRFPHMRLKIHNAGVGGARAWDALQRFDQDVAKYHPKYVTLLLGMNDGVYQPYDQNTFTTYRQDMSELLDRLEKIGAKAIPMSPTMFDARAKRLYGRPGMPEESIKLYNSVLAYYGTWLREICNERGLGYVDMWSPLNNLTLEGRETDASFTLIRDAVHPDAPGQVVMATAIINDLELPKLVSSVSIHKTPAGSWKATARNGELQNLSESDGEITFHFTAHALPWVLPAEAQLGVQLTKLGHRFSRELLKVNGLSAGKYTVSIDGTAIGSYSADQLAGGVELEANEKTPQYQQALKVAELNKQRNEGPVKQLRDEWRHFQQYARAKRQLELMPNTTGLADQVAKLEKANEGMQERLESYNAAAREIEDQIFKINQPKQQQYQIAPVK